jgi:transketolase
VKPLDEALLCDSFQRFPLIAAIEEHSIIGGLGSAVAEWLAALPTPAAGRFLSFGTPDRFLGESGSQEYARQCCGLTAANIARQIIDCLVSRASPPARAHSC